MERLTHPNGWWRDAAQRTLVERGDKAAVAPLVKLAGSATDWRTRLHALWTLDGLDAIEPAAITKALEDPSRDVRVAAIRISEKWLGEASSPVREAVLRRLEDKDWAVRHQLAASLGVLPASARDTALASLLERHGDDPITLDAALSGLRGVEMAVLEKLQQSGGPATPQREAALTMFSATIVRGAQDVAIQTLFGSIADDGRPAWQRAALLRGTEVAILGATMPGMPARRGGPPPATAPCPTCPGARGGPGGAYAFGGPGTTAQAGRGRGGVRALRLSREPALAALAAKGGDLGTRAGAVLARVEWPGKPGVAAPLPPLTAGEQQRFNAGQEIYRNVCQACHQPDGRGMDKLAPSLIESAFAVGPPEVPVRILLHGKEGPIGLMPPVGQVFTDEQLASVLTYIRREWGLSGSAVDAATVKAVRDATPTRTRPWTNDELTALMPAGK